jgi:hypothetical protein
LQALRNDLEFWRFQQDGLALFCNEKEFYYVKLPISFEEDIVIGEQFHILPLIPAITGTYDFYVLQLDQKDMKLYRSHHYSLQPVPVPLMPANVEEALALDNPGRNIQFRQGIYSGGAGGGASFHGQGVDNDAAKQKENILEYFRKSNDAIMNVIGSDTIPLVTAGVDYLHSLYREANTYRHIVAKGITKKTLDAQELYLEAGNLLEPYFKKVEQDALTLYGNMASKSRTSDDLSEIVKGAFSGRISHLFVKHGAKQTGNFDFRNFDVIVHNTPVEGAVDLISVAVSQTIKNNGILFLIEADKMPNSKSIAAIFRY